MRPRPFTNRVDDTILADLAERMARVRWPDQARGTEWEYGASLEYPRDLDSPARFTLALI